MKTTVDLSDDLMRTMKILAAKHGRTLKDVMEDLLRQGLSAQARPTDHVRRVQVPLVQCAHPATEGDEVTPDRLAEILAVSEADSLVQPR